MNKFLTIAIVLMLLVTSVALFATRETATQLPPDSASGKAAIGGGFTLTDIHGKPVSDTQFRGKHMLVFFGFTRCPMICPTTMATISRAMELLGDKAKDVVPVFISVDSEYDKPEQVKAFLANFDSRIVGLTGTPEQIKTVADEYKAYYAEQNGMMDHSTLIYWMDGNGEYIDHFSYDVEPEQIAKRLSEKLP